MSLDATLAVAQDITAANRFMQTHPLSHFRENRFAAHLTPAERSRLLTLAGPS